MTEADRLRRVRDVREVRDVRDVRESRDFDRVLSCCTGGVCVKCSCFSSLCITLEPKPRKRRAAVAWSGESPNISLEPYGEMRSGDTGPPRLALPPEGEAGAAYSGEAPTIKSESREGSIPSFLNCASLPSKGRSTKVGRRTTLEHRWSRLCRCPGSPGWRALWTSGNRCDELCTHAKVCNEALTLAHVHVSRGYLEAESKVKHFGEKVGSFAFREHILLKYRRYGRCTRARIHSI